MQAAVQEAAAVVSAARVMHEAAAAKAAATEAAAAKAAQDAGWVWDDEWKCYYDQAQVAAEAHIEAQAQQMVDEHDAAVVQECLDDVISELQPPTYCDYELNRQRTIVSNTRMLLDIARKAESDALACSTSSAHTLSFLRDDVRKAEANVRQSVCRLEYIEQCICECLNN